MCNQGQVSYIISTKLCKLKQLDVNYELGIGSFHNNLSHTEIIKIISIVIQNDVFLYSYATRGMNKRIQAIVQSNLLVYSCGNEQNHTIQNTVLCIIINHLQYSFKNNYY